jgi:streptomycin 6-kinase
VIDDYLKRWALVPDGKPIFTQSSQLLPVRWNNIPAMLKLALNEEEAQGNRRMAWWDGQGAARVFAQEGHAILIERATGEKSLADMVHSGRDEEACHIICAAIVELHRPRNKPPPRLVPLEAWFSELSAAAADGILRLAATTAQDLLKEPRDVTVLHGDIHHGNILDFGERGWLAIDPKGVTGERYFDYANLFCNPSYEVAADAALLQQRIDSVSKAARLESTRLLRWVLAWAALSAVWSIEDGGSPTTALAVAELAAAELRQ